MTQIYVSVTVLKLHPVSYLVVLWRHRLIVRRHDGVLVHRHVPPTRHKFHKSWKSIVSPGRASLQHDRADR